MRHATPTKKLIFHAPDELIAQLKSESERLGAPYSEICRRAILAYFGEEGASVKPATSYPEYAAYRQRKNRCENPSNPSWKDYGERGIEFRFKSFEEFYNHIGPRPSLQHSCDRIDNNGHYEIGNVRWATAEVQSSNTRRSTSATAVLISPKVSA